MRDALDFQGRQVLVVGGSSGHRATALPRRFAAAGPGVQIWGTRASASDYDGVRGLGSAGAGLPLRRPVRPGRAGAHSHRSGPARCSGAVAGGRCATAGGSSSRSTSITSSRSTSTAFRRSARPALIGSGRRAASVITVSSTAAYSATRGNPAYAASKARAGRPDAHAGAGLGGRGHPRQRHCPGAGRHQADPDHHPEPRAPGALARRHSAGPHRPARGHGGGGAVSGLAAGRLRRRPDAPGRRRADALGRRRTPSSQTTPDGRGKGPPGVEPDVRRVC